MIKNCDITELEAKGTVFLESDAAGKTISCGLTNPDQWLTQTVELTLEKVNDSAKKTICTTDLDNGFSCTGNAAGIASYVPTDDSKGTEVLMTATLDGTTLTSTVAYRCSVKVGANEDEIATDTKLIYVQKISVKYRNDNLDEYQKMTTADKLEVSVYGDDAYALQSADSNCRLKKGDKETATVGFISSKCTIQSESMGTDLKLVCDLKFKDIEVTDGGVVTYKPDDTLTVTAVCGAGQFERSQECVGCTSDNGYRQLTMSQFGNCRMCPSGQEPNDAKNGCKACGSGFKSTSDTRCIACDAGTVLAGTTCVACPAGQYQADSGQTSCVSCPAGQYSPVPGSQTCTPCPSGTISTVGAVSCTTCGAGKKPNGAQTDCESCDAGKYSVPGSSECSDCPAGTTSVAGGECTKCPKGEFNDADGGECKDCENGSYSAVDGSTFCLTCQGKISDEKDSCKVCEAGKKFDDDNCVSCEKGEVSEAGSATCNLCPPGRFKDSVSTCKLCPKGKKQPVGGQEECILCDVQRGEFQTQEGSTYCKTTTPGHQLHLESNTEDEVPCEKNSYSTGGASTCSKCESGKGEYTDSTGSTYCNVCQFNLDSAGNCGTISCKGNKIELEGIGSGNFTFPDTSAGGTASVKCDESNNGADGEMITRYCRYNALTKEVEWASADSSACSSKFTEDVKDKVNKMNDVNVKDPTATKAAVKDMKDLATKANEMAPKDLSNIATSLSTFTDSLAEQGVEVDEEEASGLASTIGSVAGAGEEKMASVSETEKTEMRGCVTTIAKQLKESVPVQTDSIGMQKFSVADMDSETPLTLPKPKNDTVSAPTLKMKGTPKADGQTVAPTVAVFNKKTAAAIFPMPSTPSDEETNSDGGSTKSKNITYAIDSSIVSLEFAGTTELDIEIEIAVDTSKDVEQSSRNVERIRTCKFYNETAKEWSTKGCETKEGETISGDEKHYLCACQHNTSFAIILSSAEIADTVQSTVSSVLNVINLVFLGLTFLCIAPFKQFQARRLIQIQTQLCIALFVGHISFLILGTTNASNKACVPGVIIVQYLFLVAVAWSVCASVTLYEKIVNALKSFGKQDKHYFVKCLAGCWSAPLFMVLAAYITSISLDANLPYVTATGELDDDKTETCWVASPWKWVGFIIPVYLCLGINVILFVMIARIIIRAGKSGSNTSHAREIKAIMSIATTVCLPWLVALLMAGPPAMAQIFQWVFIIVTASQGPTMFICFVIFQEDVLTNLFSLFGKEPPQVLLAPKSSKASKSAASEISSVKPTTAAVKKEEKSDIVHVKNPEYNDPAQEEENRQSEENIYSKVDEEAPAVKDDTISRGSVSSKHMYEATSFTQHGDKNDNITPVPAVEQGETYENNAANDLDIAQNSYPHVPQLV